MNYSRMTALLIALTFSSSAAAATDLSGVWLLVKHDRPGGIFGSPADPVPTTQGQALIDAFYSEIPEEAPERNAYCVPSGMPETMFGMAGYPMDIIQRDERITLVSEFQTQLRRIFTDGRDFPEDYPLTRNGYSIGQWVKEEGRDVLNVETGYIQEWYADRWVHSDQAVIVESFSLRNPEDVGISPEQVNGKILEVKLVMTDPVMYSQPETLTVYFEKKDDSIMLEYNCVEYTWHQEIDRLKEQ